MAYMSVGMCHLLRNKKRETRGKHNINSQYLQYLPVEKEGERIANYKIIILGLQLYCISVPDLKRQF